MALQSLPLARRRGCAAVARTTGRPSVCFGADLADGAACSHRGLHCGPACAAQPIMRRRKRRVAQQPPLRRPPNEFLRSFWTDRADGAHGTAWRAQSGARRSEGSARRPWRGASTAHPKPKSRANSHTPPFSPGGERAPPPPPPPPRRAALGPMPYGKTALPEPRPQAAPEH